MTPQSAPLVPRMMREALRRARRFRRGKDGSISVETVIIFPLIAWALAASVTFTDAFRHQTTLQKSVYTAGDLVSRANGTAITPQYLDGVFGFMLRMNDTAQPLRMRMSLIGWDSQDERLRVVWSNAGNAGAAGALDDAALNTGYAAQIPTITQGETLLLTEGWLDYTPPFAVGLRARTMTEVALTRPRFAPGITYDDPDALPPPPAWCDFIVDGCGM